MERRQFKNIYVIDTALLKRSLFNTTLISVFFFFFPTFLLIILCFRSGMLESGIDRIISQVVDPKINHTFRPQVEKAVHEFLATLNHKEDTGGSTAPDDEKPDSSTITQGALLLFLGSSFASLLALNTKLGVFSSLKYFSFWLF